MFYIGKTYRSKDGHNHTVMLHNWKGRFPIVTHDEDKKLHKFTREGKALEFRDSDKDLLNE